MATLITLGQFVLSLSILIVLHECGHFFPARWFNTRVEKFYLFFDPWFSLFKFKKGDTEYGIGWLPLGGYVKISGMIDESMDKEQMEGPPQPWEFRSKTAWQRLIIMLGGVTVNFVLGIFLFGIILFTWGTEFLPNENAKYGIVVQELGASLGLEDGDKVLAVGDEKLDKFNPSSVSKGIVFDDAKTITVERNGQVIDLTVPDSAIHTLSAYANKDKTLYGLRMPTTIESVPDGMPSKKAGLQNGDRIIGINNQSTPYYDQLIRNAMQLKNQTVSLTYLRNNDTLTTSLTLDSLGKMGFFAYTGNEYFETDKIEYSFGQAMASGWNDSWGFLGSQIKAFGKMFTGELKAKDSVGGPIAIAQMFTDKNNPTSWNWQKFWQLTGMLSLILAFMNLLPIPALDGGHVMFLLYEILTGRKPSDIVLEYATVGGFIILMTLMVLIFGNDILRIFNNG